MPINLDYLQSKSFQYIKNYVSLNKSQFIELVKVIRGLNIPLYDDQPIDINYSNLVEEVSKDFAAIQERFLNQIIDKFDIVITTAQIPGKKAPLLITKEMVAKMRPGSVIVDMAASSGGKCWSSCLRP